MKSLSYWTRDPDVADLKHEELEAPYRVRLSIDGHMVDAMLDSGATTSMVTTEAARLAGVRTADVARDVQHNRGVGDSDVSARVGVFDDVTIGAETIAHARLLIAALYSADRQVRTGSLLARPYESRDLPAMLLGADFLRSHHVLLASDQGWMYFTYSGGPVFQAVGGAAAEREMDPARP